MLPWILLLAFLHSKEVLLSWYWLIDFLSQHSLAHYLPIFRHAKLVSSSNTWFANSVTILRASFQTKTPFFEQVLANFILVKLRMSIVYQPQADDWRNVLDRHFQQYVRCLFHDKPSNRRKFLHCAEWQYNTSVHSATELYPFQVVYGKPPANIPSCILRRSNIEVVETTLTTRDDILQLLKPNLLKAEQKMKSHSDKHL